MRRLLGQCLATVGVSLALFSAWTTAARAQERDASRIDVVLAAMTHLRKEPSLFSRPIPSDSILLDVGVALGPSPSAGMLDSVAALLDWRVTADAFQTCSRSAGTSATIKRAACSFERVVSYLEVTRFRVEADSAVVAVAVLERAKRPPRARNVWSAIGGAFGRALGRDPGGPAVRLQTHSLQLMFREGAWIVIPPPPAEPVASPLKGQLSRAP
jgi:hypothetical protein